MDESAIAAKLQTLIPRPEVAPAIAQATVQAEPSNEVIKDANSPNELSAIKLLDFFAVPAELRTDRATLDKLTAIYKWATELAGSSDSVDVMTKVRELEGRLGLTYRGDDKLESIYRYLKLDTQRRRIEKEMNLV